MMSILQMPPSTGMSSDQFFWWAAGIIGAVLLFLVLRYFIHIISFLFHLAMRFFWHGCVFIILLGIILAILRYFKVI
jgi:hypothetical protein